MSVKVNNKVSHIIKIVNKFNVKTPYKPKKDKESKLNNVDNKNKLKPKTNQG